MQITCRAALCKIRAACGNYRAIYAKDIQMHVHFINASRPPACFILWIIDFILQIFHESEYIWIVKVGFEYIWWPCGFYADLGREPMVEKPLADFCG